jgi:drug/metabolite transporter (DMT)-like permease
MKALTGSVLVLAGAVLFAAGTVADGMMQSAHRLGNPGAVALIAGAVVGVIGLTVFAAYLRAEPSPS